MGDGLLTVLTVGQRDDLYFLIQTFGELRPGYFNFIFENCRIAYLIKTVVCVGMASYLNIIRDKGLSVCPAHHPVTGFYSVGVFEASYQVHFFLHADTQHITEDAEVVAMPIVSYQPRTAHSIYRRVKADFGSFEMIEQRIEPLRPDHKVPVEAGIYQVVI